MGIWLDPDEQRELLGEAHTGVLTTLRADGRPVALPVWFVLLDGEIYLRTPSRSAKVRRARRHPAGTFLVYRGLAWAELTAVQTDVEITVVQDPELAARAAAALDRKYEEFRLRPEDVPAATLAAYADMAILRLTPVGRPLSWANAKIRLA